MTERKKRGRPPFLWHGQLGEEFVRAVQLDWWQMTLAQVGRRPRRISITHAIKNIRLRREFPHLKKYKVGYLKRQYSSLKEFWSLCRVDIREIKKPTAKKPASELVEQNLELVEQKIDPQLFT